VTAAAGSHLRHNAYSGLALPPTGRLHGNSHGVEVTADVSQD
jgi:hypothetical protein